MHEQLAATLEQFIAELSSSLNGIKVSFIEALLPKSIFQFKQAHSVYFSVCETMRLESQFGHGSLNESFAVFTTLVTCALFSVSYVSDMRSLVFITLVTCALFVHYFGDMRTSLC